MNTTQYARELCQRTGDRAALEKAIEGLTGASVHAKACTVDTGLEVVLTGVDAKGKRFRRTAKSVCGAWFTMKACHGLRNAWHVENGKRRLLISA